MESLDFILDLRDTLKKQRINFFLVCSRKNKKGEFNNQSYFNIDDPNQLKSMFETFEVDTKEFIESGGFDEKIIKNAKKTLKNKKNNEQK